MHTRLWRALWLLPFLILGDGYVGSAQATAKTSFTRSPCVASPQNWPEACIDQRLEEDPDHFEFAPFERLQFPCQDHRSHGRQKTIVEVWALPRLDERDFSTMLEVRHRMGSLCRQIFCPTRIPTASTVILQPRRRWTEAVLGCSCLARTTSKKPQNQIQTAFEIQAQGWTRGRKRLWERSRGRQRIWPAACSTAAADADDSLCDSV